MNVIEFPLARLESRRQKNALAKAGFKPTNSVLFELGVVANNLSFESADKNVLINPNDVNHDILLDFVMRFACFKECEYNWPQEILDHYLSDRLSDAQDRVIEGVLELISNYYLGFSVIDAFEIWGREDRTTYLEILKEYSSALN